MLWLKIILTLAAGYGIVVGLAAVFQTKLIFPTYIANAWPPALPGDARRLEATGAGGHRLVGTHLPPRVAGDLGMEGTLILGFGGNASDADHVALMLQALYPTAHVVVFHYRGYGRSEGSPSAQGLLEDSLIVHDRAVTALKPKRVVAVGISNGSGIAAYVAKHRSLAGLILVTPFDSIEAMAKGHYGWLPVGLFLRHRMAASEFLKGNRTPTALIAAENDQIVPLAHTQALKRVVGNLVFERVIADAHHNDIYGRAEFADAMAQALARIRAAAP
ncbi:MAG: alpha/beta fold hydrolase [Alphaproteobacteria bacterium]|nr:alpha/beta fold hydrolase [Alphaproteobacteria bacterium]